MKRDDLSIGFEVLIIVSAWFAICVTMLFGYEVRVAVMKKPKKEPLLWNRKSG